MRAWTGSHAYRRRVKHRVPVLCAVSHLTVEQNVAYGLTRGEAAPEAEMQRACGALKKVKMSAHAKIETLENQRRTSSTDRLPGP